MHAPVGSLPGQSFSSEYPWMLFFMMHFLKVDPLNAGKNIAVNYQWFNQNAHMILEMRQMKDSNLNAV